jgi:uncharacterized glyoxalase superfamily protein PhnB
MIENRSAPGAVVPNLCYDDVTAAARWLCDVFGFSERYRYGPNNEVIGAQLALGDAIVMLFGPRRGHGDAADFEFHPPRRGASSHAITIRVDDVDRHHDRARASGAQVLLPLQTYAFGERQYSVEDFAGRLWTFSQSVADVPPEDWGATLPNDR